MKASNESTLSALTHSSIPSQNVDSDVKNPSTPALGVNMDNVQKERVDTGHHISGYIFMCNSKTKPECFTYRVFGLPASRMAIVEKIKPNTKLFLFDFDVKLLYGLYVADSSGKLAIQPYAFGGRFPAQVKFSIARDCLPLPEVAFKDAIRENYRGRSKFKQDLSEEQVNKLVSLFRPIIIPSPPQAPPVFNDTVETSHPPHGGSSFRITNLSLHGQCSAGSHHFNMHPSSTHIHEVPLPPVHLAHNQVPDATIHTVASQPFHSQPFFSQGDPVHVPETYHPGLYQHDTLSRYDITARQPTSADSYYAPNPMPLSHICPRQSVAPLSSMTAAQWVAMASEAQTP